VSLEIDMKLEEGASQLSAMFDGELPAAECELLSRRLARDEQLRARWARYALIGAAMRSEPVAAVSGDFSRRVGAAIDGGAATGVSGRPGRNLPWMRNLALGAGVAAGVAGAAIFVLRSEVLLQDQALSAYTPTAVRMAGPAAAAPAMQFAASAAMAQGVSREPLSYVVPLNVSSSDQALPASLANYMVAHSEYSSPLLRRGLISALVASDMAESVKPGASGSAAAGPAPDNGGY
jgi:negative regulator of sigma E activity